MAQLKSTQVFGDLNVTGEVNVSTKITVNGEEVWDTGNLLNIGTTAATARTALGLGAGATRWPTFDEVTGKPTSYTPSSHTHTWSQVTGQPATATRWPTFDEVTGKPTTFTPASHTHAWAQVTGQPATATRWPTFAEVTGKPTTFTPSSHTHPVSQITGLGTVPFTATGLSTTDINTVQEAGYYFQDSNANATAARNYPSGGGLAGTLVVTKAAGVVQEYTTYGSGNRKFIRGYYGTAWSAWAEIYHTGNMPATATRWPTFAEVSGKPANYPTTWASVAAQPATATRWPTFAEVTGKPTTFTPSSHTHAWAQVTGAPAQATRWPTWAEVSGKPSVSQTTGTSTTDLMSQKATTDAINTAVASSSGPSSAVYTYDSGRVVKITDNGGNTIIGYNANGTVHSITHPDGQIETFAYDSLGNVSSTTVS